MKSPGFHSKAVQLGVIFAAAVLLIPAASLEAQSLHQKLGTQYTVTADARVQRPKTSPCLVSLFTNYQFAFFPDTTQTFQFAPPSDCSAPWEKVVLDVEFSENAGRQFDRTASLYLDNVNLYFGTTPEPLSSKPNHWHIEREVTDYSPLFENPQQGTMVLQNCTTDCPAPYNTELNGVFTVSARLEFYPAGLHRRAPRTPDRVLPLTQSNGSGGLNQPAFLFTATDQLSSTFNLPHNVEQAYLDVIAQSQQLDEQWYACFPNDLASINEVYGCGNTDFRETEVTIDGQPAGIAPVSPWVFTGFLPDQWVPIPAAQTLDFVPYRVNLTPFAGLLSDGQPHTIALSVFNNGGYFSAVASLLLYLDRDSAQISGAVTRNTLSSPNPSVTENLQGTSTVTGTIGVSQKRDFTIEGYIESAHGRVTTSVWQQQSFSSIQSINFDTVNFTVLKQKTSVDTRVKSLTTVFSRGKRVATAESFSFPIRVDFTYPVNSAEFGFTVATRQNYQNSRLVWRNGAIGDFISVSNSVHADDVSPASSAQHYTLFDLTNRPYDCRIASSSNTLSKVSFACGY